MAVNMLHQFISTVPHISADILHTVFLNFPLPSVSHNIKSFFIESELCILLVLLVPVLVLPVLVLLLVVVFLLLIIIIILLWRYSSDTVLPSQKYPSI